MDHEAELVHGRADPRPPLGHEPCLTWVAETGMPRLRINAMKCCSAGHVVAVALSSAAGLLSPAMSQTPKPEIPQATGREPGRSSPPDTTPYVRPVIPEDCLRTPLPAQGGADAGATPTQHSRPMSKPPEVPRLPQPTPGADCGQ